MASQGVSEGASTLELSGGIGSASLAAMFVNTAFPGDSQLPDQLWQA